MAVKRKLMKGCSLWWHRDQHDLDRTTLIDLKNNWLN
jgi:hypothetical protein